MATEYARALGAKCGPSASSRGSPRTASGESEGKWKAVVVGSYERATGLSPCRNWQNLADFYGVPVAELLPDSSPGSVAEPPSRLILDLERLGRVPADKVGPLARYAAAIQAQRGDYNGKVLSIRQDDLPTGRDLRRTAGRARRSTRGMGCAEARGNSLSPAPREGAVRLDEDAAVTPRSS